MKTISNFIGVGVGRLVRRWKMRRLRNHKAATFLGRWDRACNRLWIKFQQKPRTTETMIWMDRNHNRLLRVCQNETRKLSLPNAESIHPESKP